MIKIDGKTPKIAKLPVGLAPQTPHKVPEIAKNILGYLLLDPCNIHLKWKKSMYKSDWYKSIKFFLKKVTRTPQSAGGG